MTKIEWSHQYNEKSHENNAVIIGLGSDQNGVQHRTDVIRLATAFNEPNNIEYRRYDWDDISIIMFAIVFPILFTGYMGVYSNMMYNIEYTVLSTFFILFISFFMNCFILIVFGDVN